MIRLLQVGILQGYGTASIGQKISRKIRAESPMDKNPFTSSLRNRSPYASKTVTVGMYSDRPRGYEIEVLVPAYHALNVPIYERPLEVEQRASTFFGML